MSLINARRGAFTVGALHDDGRGVRRHRARARTWRSRCSASPASRTRRCRSPSSRWRRICSSATKSRPWRAWPAPAATPGVLIFSLLIGALVTTHRLHAVLRRPRACSICSARSCSGRSCASSGRHGCRVAWPRRQRMTRSFAIRSSAASIPIRRSSASATTTTSRPRRSSGSRACRSTTRATSCTGGCSRGRSTRASQLNMRGDPDSCGVWAPCLTHADGLFYLIYTDVKRYGRTTAAGASGASLRDFHNYLVTSAAHRRRLVRPGLPQQQRLRSVAVSRRRRPQVPAQHAVGSPARAATASPASCCRSTRRASGGWSASARTIFDGHAARLHRSAAPLQARRLVLPAHRRRRHGLGPRRDDGALARRCCGPVRAASRRPHPERAPSARRARCSAPGHADLVETPERRDLHGLSVRPAAARTAAAARSAARRRSSR